MDLGFQERAFSGNVSDPMLFVKYQLRFSIVHACIRTMKISPVFVFPFPICFWFSFFI